MNPFTVRQIGTVIQAGRGPFRRVQWEDGRVERAPVPLPKGQRFSCVTTRTAAWRIVKIENIEPLPPLRHDPERSQALWDHVMNKPQETHSWDEIL